MSGSLGPNGESRAGRRAATGAVIRGVTGGGTNGGPVGGRPDKAGGSRGQRGTPGRDTTWNFYAWPERKCTPHANPSSVEEVSRPVPDFTGRYVREMTDARRGNPVCAKPHALFRLNKRPAKTPF